MASKKKKSPKKGKKSAAKKKAVKKVKKKAVKKKVVARKPKKGKKAAAKKSPKKVKPVKTKAPATPSVPSGERVGIVTHYYSHLQVAIILVESGMLRTGDTVHIKGHTSDFSQVVESMEVDHMHVDQVGPGQSFGLRVKEHAREHDVVYKTPRM